MSATEVILIIIGFIAVVVGYVMPAHMGATKQEINIEKAKKHVDHVVRHSLNDAKETIRGQIEDSLEENLVKSERGMERITNDKMTAISEYADTVMGDIHKNHDEVVFMYDMLNDKHKNLTTLVSDVSKSAADARQTVLDAELTARESMETAGEAMEQIRQARAELELLISDAKKTLGTDRLPKRELNDDAGQNQRSNASIQESQETADQDIVPVTDMARIEDERFTSLLDSFTNTKPYIFASDDIHRVLQSDKQTPEQEDAADMGTMVAEMLASKKVVPISNGSRGVRTRMDFESWTPPMDAGALAYAEDAIEEHTPPIQDRQDVILQMHNQGKSNVAIARELGVGVGEVRLVIDLFSNKRKAKKA